MTTKRKVGRPPVDDQRKPVVVKMTSTERKEVETAAKRVGLEMSTWMRFICLQEARKINGE